MIGRETFAQGRHVGQLVCREIIREDHSEFGLATAIMGERKEIDHQSTGGLLGSFADRRQRGQMVTVNKVGDNRRCARAFWPWWDGRAPVSSTPFGR
jgi:hypothetical protein